MHICMWRMNSGVGWATTTAMVLSSLKRGWSPEVRSTMANRWWARKLPSCCKIPIQSGPRCFNLHFSQRIILFIFVSIYNINSTQKKKYPRLCIDLHVGVARENTMTKVLCYIWSTHMCIYSNKNNENNCWASN